MKAILVDPGAGESSFGTFSESHWSSIIHHGLCSISAYAKREGFDIELIDIRQLQGWEHFKQEITDRNPHVVGLSMRSFDFNMVMKAVDIIKNCNSRIITVVGGVHPTIATDEVAANENIDYIITGEGEISFTNLLKKIEKGQSDERIIRGIPPDLDQLPFDDRELYDYKVTISHPNYPGVFKPPMVTMIASRGCPYNCSFCAPHARKMFGKGVRARSVDHVIEELKILRDKYDFYCIKFYDYSFTANPNWIYEFCDKYQSNGFTQSFLCQSRADLICRHEDSIKRLSEVGLKLMLVGFESGNQRVLNFLRKGTTVEQNLKAAEICKKYGVMVGGSFMLGIPTETKEEVRDTIELVKKIKPHFTSVSFFTPIPGNDLYDYCMENDLSLITSYDQLVDFAPSTPKIKGVDYDFLRDAASEIMGVKFGGKISGKIVRFFYITTKNKPKFRNFLVRCYSQWVSSSIYRLLNP